MAEPEGRVAGHGTLAGDDWLTRFGGTAISRAKAVGVTPNSDSSSRRLRRGVNSLKWFGSPFCLVVNYRALVQIAEDQYSHYPTGYVYE